VTLITGNFAVGCDNLVSIGVSAGNTAYRSQDGILYATDPDDPNASKPASGYSLDISSTIDELKKDVLFRPPEVDKCVEDITNDPANYACGNLLGQW
jgi:hypothetical protein